MSYILLVNPSRVYYPPSEHDFTGDEVSPPLGLLSLAAVLQEQGDDVEIFDNQISEEPYEDFLQQRSEERERFVGISCVFPYRDKAIEYIQKTHAIWPNAILVAGGPDATFAAKEYLEHGAKFVVRGEGESTFSQLISSTDYQSMQGVVFRDKDGKLCDRGWPAPLDNLDKLPFPARELVDLRKYHRSVTSMISSRGCRYHCSFCSSREFWGQQYRSRSPLLIAQEIEKIYTEFKFEKIRHQDDNWAERGEDFLLQLRDELKRMGLIGKIEHEIETSPCSLLEKGKIDLIAEIGVSTVWMGMETADDTLRMHFLRKPYTYDQIKKSVNLLKQAKIKVGLFLIFGIPQETYDDAKKTIDMADELEPEYVGASILTRYPGTTLHRELRSGEARPKMFSKLVGWGHSGEFLGKKMTIEDLLRVFAYAYDKFGRRLGNWYNMEQLFRIPEETWEVLRQLETAKMRLNFLNTSRQLQELVKGASTYSKAAISVQVEKTIGRMKNGDIPGTFLANLREIVGAPRSAELAPAARPVQMKKAIRFAIKSKRVVRDAIITIASIAALVTEGLLLNPQMWYSRVLYFITVCLGIVGAYKTVEGFLEISQARSMAYEVAPSLEKESLEEYRTRNVTRIVQLLEDELRARLVEFGPSYQQRSEGDLHRLTLQGTRISEILVETSKHHGDEFDPSLVDPLFNRYQIKVRITFQSAIATAQFLAQKDEYFRFERRNTANEADIMLQVGRWLPSLIRRWLLRPGNVYITERNISLLEEAIRNHVLPFLTTD